MNEYIQNNTSSPTAFLYKTGLFPFGDDVYVVYETTDDLNSWKPIFWKKIGEDLPIQNIFISRDREGITIHAICERLTEEEADQFFNASLEFQLEHDHLNFDIRLIELKGRALKDLNFL